MADDHRDSQKESEISTSADRNTDPPAAGTSETVYNVTVKDGQGVAIGDHPTVNIYNEAPTSTGELERRRSYLLYLVECVGSVDTFHGGSVDLERVYVNGLTKSATAVSLRTGGIECSIIDDLLGRERAPEVKEYRSYWLQRLATWWVSDHGVTEGNHSIPLSIADAGTVIDRLVVLGTPGSGKSTFVRHLTLCLAGASMDGWIRTSLKDLAPWSHGALTPIFVDLRRFVTASTYPNAYTGNPTADTLLRYLQTDSHHEVSDYAADLQRALEAGSAVLVLDGLDEIPFDEGHLADRQRQMQELMRSLTARFPASRYVVTTRPYAYEGWSLAGFTAVTLADFDDAARIALTTRLFESAGDAQEVAGAKAESLVSQLAGIPDGIIDRPLFVTMVAAVYLAGGGLPSSKADLYNRCIRHLIDRWTQSKRGAPTLLDLLGGVDLEILLDRLSVLAYDVHAEFGERPNEPEIPAGWITDRLRSPFGFERGAKILRYLNENAGVLLSPGQDTERDVFHFAHRSFQEYLAARHIVALCKASGLYGLVRELIMQKPELWREVGLLVGDVVMTNDGLDGVLALVDDLLVPAAVPEADGDGRHFWAIWLAAAVCEHTAAFVPIPKRSGQRAVCDALRNYILTLIETPLALPPIDRAVCGRALSLLGDPRPGVGLRPDGLPNVEWCDVPAGEFLYGDPARTVEVDAFRIARYPVTYAQFQVFIVDPDGYANPDWWRGLHKYGCEQQSGPGDQAFKFANHPCERVSWYDAMAFCAWLSSKPGYEGVRLPTEEEWERAARGTDGRVYPWEGEFDSARANTYAGDTPIGQTSAVGLFPTGASPCGALDVSGNVWEWTRTENDSRDSANISSNLTRVLRGGSWFVNSDFARAAFRYYFTPAFRNSGLGFRLASPATNSEL